MRILLVEDSEEVSRITIEYLHDLGHQALAVAAAEEAIDVLKETRFDAVITDLTLPGMSGIQLARALLEEFSNLPVILCSGYGAIKLDSLLGDDLDSVLVLPKPYDLPDLEGVLTRAAAIAERTGSSHLARA